MPIANVKNGEINTSILICKPISNTIPSAVMEAKTGLSIAAAMTAMQLEIFCLQVSDAKMNDPITNDISNTAPENQTS